VKFDNQKFHDWLKLKFGGTPACPLCGKRNWTLLDRLLRFSNMEEGGAYVIGGPQVPVVAMLCMNCNHLATFAALPIGLLEQRTRPQENDGEVSNG